MIKPSDVIKATGSDPSKPMSDTNPLGTGFMFWSENAALERAGSSFHCTGPDRHPIMSLLDVPADGKDMGVVPSERADEAKWNLDEAQTAMSVDNPVCQTCGSGITH